LMVMWASLFARCGLLSQNQSIEPKLNLTIFGLEKC
jgi:hypothetical protein